MKKFLLGFILFSIGIAVNAQTYVNANATGANNGTSWTDAYTDLHSATYNTTSGEIWVAQGTYVPSKTFTNNIPGNNSLKTFRVQFNVQVYGGFNGTETTLNQRNWKNNPTIISGDVGGGLKSYNVIRFDGNDNTTVLDGFIVQDGLANGTTEFLGGAIYSSNASPTIRNCKFINNSAQQYGGAVYLSVGSTPQVLNCEFTNNTTTQYDGAALYINGGTSAVVANCLFNGNISSSGSAGAVVILNTATSQVNNCTFVNNQAASASAGKTLFLLRTTGSPVMSVNNCVFYNNLPIGYGDVNRSSSSSYTANNCYSDAGNTGFTNNNGLTNIVTGNPFFTDFDNDDFTLQCKSALVNSGSTSGLTIPSTDLSGNTRVFGTAIDMGAYENSSTTIGVEASKTTICNGDYVILKGICDPTGYSWDNGVTNGVPFYPTTTQTGTATTEQITITVLNLTDENVSGPNSVCYNTSATVNLANSVNGVEYFLRNDATGVIVDGQITGTGNAIDFNTSNIISTTTYNVVGTSAPQYVDADNLALDFDGTNDQVETSFVLPQTNTLTIEAFIYPRSSNFDRIVSNYTAATAGNFIVDTYNATNNGRGLRFVAYSPTNTLAQHSVANVLTLNTWNHVAITFDNGAVKFFVNGVQVASSTFAFSTISLTSNILCFGEDPGVGVAEYYNGKMDEVRIWNVARTSVEINDNKDNCLVGNETGLLAYYNFENGAGTTVTDLVNANNGVMYAMDPATDWVSSNVTCGTLVVTNTSGTALDFDGTNDMVTTGFIMPATSTFSIESWVYPRSTNYDRIVSNYSSAVNGSIILDTYYGTDNGRGVRFNVYGTGNALYSVGAANALTLNAWNHVTATFNNGTMVIYVNGFEVVTGTAPFTSIPQITSNFVFGEDKVIGTAEYLNGKLDEVRFWNKALSQSEIMADMNNCLTGTEADLLAYYNFEDASGTTVSDITPNQINGTMQNMDANTDWVAGQFACIVTCSQEMTQMVTIAPVNVDNTTSLNGSQISSNQAGASYRWLDCNNSNAVISGETAQTFVPTANGNYAVEITLNGCTDTSACVNLTTVGINNINKTNMSISPNPVRDYLFINGNEQVIKATIYTINGSLVQTLHVENNKINVANLSQGMYILVVHTDNGITQNKFIKE
ncbi:MAG: T9SS type A sorting domain-containing protein [Bacteroidetes bacterium]|nr:T9SS type A sorting domain-containing protein [Bacteroidota bacterium]